MTLETVFYEQIRKLGYWDRTESINSFNANHPLSLAWSNPNTTVAPETMFQITWLLASTRRRQRLNPIDVRILDRTAADIAYDGHIIAATVSYVSYLWEQVYRQEFPHAVPEK
ncbi:hypothetical protein JJD41_08560 [Oxynema sp. CENA135]|jgi:hypothetical protein|uniref:Uncharacterized protein n=1 Tax=Oxynema aestuarii AP17 TaxID=2064643 RepID=A0A6H1U044_9CYAN|nr:MULTISPECIES: hypothetical protein [Oxynema]MBK4729913.1 hypothetical protein [Oxynema sp. CENA135]QIZ72025.1 hypothetical protein HCG48_16735 [Oxynema aestuarii AP17]RMH72443.1 MAG: hypothetical protein D6680_19390 [Cyanobacteria bacterium J007]